jgi:hypothetical protein
MAEIIVRARFDTCSKNLQRFTLQLQRKRKYDNCSNKVKDLEIMSDFACLIYLTGIYPACRTATTSWIHR